MNGVTIYLRRSVVDDDNPGAVSYEQQLRRCRELAKLHGASEPDVLVDWGRSGGEGLEHRRGAYQQLRDGIAMGAVRWVVSYDLSRLSRSTRETLDLVDHAQRHGARVHVGDLGILDPDDPTGTFTLTVLSGANKLTRDMARQRAKEQVMVRRSQGLPIGRPPYGSRPGEDVAAVVAAYTEGGSYHAAARLLNGRGIRARMGGDWSGKTVRNVVRRAEPVDTTARRRVRSRGRYILTGLPRCACGQPMRVVGSPWGPVAICGRGIADSSHPRPIQVSEAKLLPWLRAEAARLQLPDAVELEVATDERRRDELGKRRQRIIDAFIDGVIGKAERDRRLEAVDRDLAALTMKRAVLAVPALDWSWPPHAINAVLRALWEHVQLDERMQPVSAEWALPAEYITPDSGPQVLRAG